MGVEKEPSSSPEAGSSIRKKIEDIKRQRIVGKKVVNLADYRRMRQNLETRRILCVDDDEIMRNALKRILEGQGYEVVLAEDGLELSKSLESAKFDMILLDVNLPWVDGYELCRIIKDHPQLKETPVIMVSARKAPEEIESGFEAGCDDYVTKPFDVEYMTTVINNTFLKSS